MDLLSKCTIHLISIFINTICFIPSSYSLNKVTKIVGIHSYSEDFPWTAMITESYKEELTKGGLAFELKNFYFDVKRNPFPSKQQHPLTEGFQSKLNEIKPDLIFITDDFALNQLSDFLIKKGIPFIFSGINGEIPKKIQNSSFKSYSGVFERYYISDTIKLIKRLLNKNSINVLLMLEESETTEYVLKYAEMDLKSVAGVKWNKLVTNSFPTWQSTILNKKLIYDAYIPLQHYSLKDEHGVSIQGTKIVEWLYHNSLKPVVYAGGWQIECGGAMSISIKPKSQGAYAAILTINAVKNMFPAPIIPPTGDIDINFITTKKLGINIPFDILSNARIIRTVQIPCNPK